MKKINALKDHAIKLVITDFNIELYLLLDGDGIAVLRNFEGDCQASIKGPLAGLVQLGKNKGDNAAMFKHKIRIEGDLHFGRTIQSILANIHIDWEEQLAKRVGDIPAHRIGQVARKFRDIAKHTRLVLTDNIVEYAQGDSQWLPTYHEVETFYQQLQTLRTDIDRAQARIQLLQKRAG